MGYSDLHKNMVWFGFFLKYVIHMLCLLLKSRANLSLFLLVCSTLLRGPWSSSRERSR